MRAKVLQMCRTRHTLQGKFWGCYSRQHDGKVLASALTSASELAEKGVGGGSTLWLLTPQFFETPKSILSSTSTGSPPQQKKVLVYTGFCCAASSDAGGRNWLTALSLDHHPTREKRSVSPTRTVTIYDGVISLFPPPFPKYSQCTFSPPTFRANAQLRKTTASSGRMERQWGHRVAATAPDTDFLEIYLLEPGVAPSLLCWLWTLEHCSSKCSPWTSSIDFTGESGRRADLRLTPAPLIQNLYVNVTPRWSTCVY